MSKLKTVQRFFPEVTSVSDAQAAIRVEVTSRDVAASKRQKHAECAMAVACKRKFKADGIVIARSTAYLIKGKHAIRFRVPPSVEREVTAFDRGAKFEPGEYALAKPDVRKKPSGPHSQRGAEKKPSAFRHITTGIRAVLGGKDARV